MAVSKSEIQVLWSTANSLSISSSSNGTSDEFSFDATAFAAKIELKADNGGTPASGDTVTFYLLEALGDPDGTGSDEFATTGHPKLLAILDTNTEDPAIKVVDLPLPGKKGKIYAVNNSSGRSITVSACIYEFKA